MHFFANDIVMVLHFAVAMKEVTEALLPGGSLNPPSKAMNPIFCTLGGVLGPAAVYFALLNAMVAAGAFPDTREHRGKRPPKEGITNNDTGW